MTTPRGPEESYESLCRELIASFSAWADDPSSWAEPLLDRWARQAFSLQLEGNEVYRRYCERRGVGPAEVSGWREVVPVPTAAFRAVDLVVGAEADASVTFRTSGTTRGVAARGRHAVRSPELYAASARAAFRAFVLAEETAPRLVTLPPSFEHDPDSSLGWMLDDLRASVGDGDGVSVATPEGVDWERLDAELDQSVEAGRPLCVLGTTVGFERWLARLEQGLGTELHLPAGSMLMDTGGEKGLPSGVSRSLVVRGLARRLGLPLESVVNEFGMTELCSQRYAYGDPAAPLVGPPWLRARVLDPVTLEELPDGEVGILCHYDLANLGSVCAVLTEDRGRVVGDGIEWIGRTAGAPPRGCSLATAELLEAQDRA
jgi:hypothetical protein